MPVLNTSISEERFEQEWMQDRDVLEQLAANGDSASTLRMVDVSFVGAAADLQPVADAALELGFTVGQLVPDDDSDQPDIWRLDLDIEQTIEPDVIAGLTRKCLEIELSFPGVEYDGWGCMAVTGADT